MKRSYESYFLTSLLVFACSEDRIRYLEGDGAVLSRSILLLLSMGVSLQQMPKLHSRRRIRRITVPDGIGSRGVKNTCNCSLASPLSYNS